MPLFIVEKNSSNFLASGYPAAQDNPVTFTNHIGHALAFDDAGAAGDARKELQTADAAGDYAILQEVD